MDIQKIHPELRQIYQYLPAIPFHNRTLQSISRLVFKLVRRSSVLKGVKVKRFQVGSTSVQVYRPSGVNSGAGLLWMHGGGFVVGSAKQDNALCSKFASDLGMTVVSVGYRLAPRHPFPAALDDCFTAWRWMGDNPELNIDPTRIAIGGMSAGGGLAACLAQRILDSGGIQPAAQLLIYPMLDDRTAADRDLDLLVHPLWNNQNNHGGWTAYLGLDPGKLSVPEYSVASRREDLSGLPPAWIGVGDIDLFYEEDKLYAERLKAAGVPCDFVSVPMAPHGFQAVVPGAELSRSFIENAIGFLSRIMN